MIEKKEKEDGGQKMGRNIDKVVARNIILAKIVIHCQGKTWNGTVKGSMRIKEGLFYFLPGEGLYVEGLSVQDTIEIIEVP